MNWNITIPTSTQLTNANGVFQDGPLAMDTWAYLNKVHLDYSRPGRPTDNPHIESFNGSFRDECLNVNWFLSLDDAREKIERWRLDYNEY